MNIASVYIYRSHGEVRAILTETDGNDRVGTTTHIVNFKAAKSVSFKQCAERAIAQLDEARAGAFMTYGGEYVSEWPESMVSTRERAESMLDTIDNYAVRQLAEQVIGEDRVPVDVLRELLLNYYTDELATDWDHATQPDEVTR